MRKTTIAACVAAGLCVAAGGGTLWAQHTAQARLQDAVAALRAGLGPDGSLSYAGAVVHPFSRSADLTDVALRLPSGRLMTAGHLALTDGGQGRIAVLRAERLRLEGSGTVATADTLEARNVSVPPPVPGQPYRIAPDAVFLDALALGGIAAEAPYGAAQLASLEVGEYGAGRHSTLRARGLTVPLTRLPGVERAGLDAAESSGLDLAGIAGALVRGEAPPRTIAAAASATLDGLYLAHGDARPVRLATLRVLTTPGPAGAYASTATVDGLVVEPVSEAMRAGFASLGLDAVRAASAYSIAFDAAGGRLTLSPLRLSVERLGTLSLAAELAHVDPAALAAQPDAAATQALVAAMQLASAHLTLVDAGLLERALALGAQRAGLPAQQLRAVLSARLRQDPAVAIGMPDPASREALAAFITDGGTLEVTLAPPAPLALGQLARLGPEAAAQLGLTVSRTPAK